MKKPSAMLLPFAAAQAIMLNWTIVYPVQAIAAPNGNVSHSVANGQRIFAQSCASCHDAHNTASKVGIGLQYYYRQHQPRPTDSSVRAIILKGKGAMPAFSALSGSRTDDLIAYLRTL